MHTKNPSVHCVKVPRVYDWLNKTTVLKLKQTVQLERKQFDDYICCDFAIPSGQVERTNLWTTYGINQIGGSLCINFKSGYDHTLVVFVNDEKQAEIREGSSFSATFTHLESIEVQCEGKSVNLTSCRGEFKIMFHYHPNGDYQLYSAKDIQKTICYVSDCYGNPLSPNNRGYSINCREIISPDNRKCVHMADECGEMILLNRVDFLVEGFVCVQFINDSGDICSKSVFPFSDVETVVLCAPPETAIHCSVIDVDCRAHIMPTLQNKSNCIEIIILLTISQSIQSVTEVVIELKGTLCLPRVCTSSQSVVQENIPSNGLAFFLNLLDTSPT
ncbi:DUF3992 domain-containing protein [Lysinibacillus sp. NPDC097195]|uniref:DUF3992 domain-containing protein n=1 Tax=Lysinibacillus sp. NPDC097195 TaxID=3364141 RepID=UPI003805A642